MNECSIVKWSSQKTPTTILLISSIIHKKSPLIFFGRKLNAAKQNRKERLVIYCSKTQHTWSVYLFTFGYVYGGMGRLFGRHDCMYGMLKNFRLCNSMHTVASILRRKGGENQWPLGGLMLEISSKVQQIWYSSSFGS